MNIVLSRCYPILNGKKITKGRLGNWIAFPLQNEKKRVEVITIYRIPSTSSNETCCSLTQYNQSERTMSMASKYRKEIFQEIQDHIRKNLEINNVIICGDYNQYIGDIQVRRFHEAIEVHEIHLLFNEIRVYRKVRPEEN